MDSRKVSGMVYSPGATFCATAALMVNSFLTPAAISAGTAAGAIVIPLGTFSNETASPSTAVSPELISGTSNPYPEFCAMVSV